jgi:2-polyprenyl-3-methyl-5-hydroxy-6-metoxy-1,4-benzoquinol methylase
MEEVHLWRGSLEQRSLRGASVKSGQFAYFDRQLDHPDWRNKIVLDFGGNVGGLLMSPDCAIEPENYYCLDVLREAIQEGRERFPSANWIHYDRYNCSFNPDGVVGLGVPEMNVKFDMVLAYSVFTHTALEEMRDLVEQLRARLKPHGSLAFTFIDPNYRSWPATYEGNNLRWRLERVREANPTLDVDGLLEKNRGADWCTLVDGVNLYINDDGVWNDGPHTCMTYNVYYAADLIRREFPNALIRQAVNGEMQHCCIIRNEA